MVIDAPSAPEIICLGKVAANTGAAAIARKNEKSVTVCRWRKLRVHIFEGSKRIVLFAVATEKRGALDWPAGSKFPAPQLSQVAVFHRLDLEIVCITQ